MAGISASPGLAIGPIRQFVRAKIVVAATARDTAGELKKLDRAIASGKRELQELFDEVWNWTQQTLGLQAPAVEGA